MPTYGTNRNICNIAWFASKTSPSSHFIASIYSEDRANKTALATPVVTGQAIVAWNKIHLGQAVEPHNLQTMLPETMSYFTQKTALRALLGGDSFIGTSTS